MSAPGSSLSTRPTDPTRAAVEVMAGQPGPSAHRWLGWICIAALVAFVADTYLVMTGLLLGRFDIPVELAVQRFPWGPIAPLMNLTNASGGWGQVVLGVVAVVGMFVYERRAGWLLALGALGSVFDSFLKVSIARHRPTIDVVHVLDRASGFSYPSGHAVFFTWVSFMVAAAISPHVHRARRALVWVAALVVVFIACTGRVYAGAHWPSDVIGGFLMALSWSAFVLWVPERWLPSPSLTWIRARARRRR